MTPTHCLFLGLFASLAAVPALASLTATATPQGEVGTPVEQVRLAFSAPVVALGATQAPDPAVLECVGAQPRGTGRWADDRNWQLELREPLPPGVRCTLRVDPRWKPSAPSSSAALSGNTEFRFSTGGPVIAQAMPWPGSEVEEDQHFLLRLNGPATEASVVRHAACEVEGLAERLPVRVVGGQEREKVLASQRLKGAAAERALLIACARPLPQGAKMRLVWGRGIGAKANPAVTTAAEQRFEYRVRAAFTAEFSCERERAQAPCLPIRPMTVRFSAPVPRAQAEAVRLVPASGTPIAPSFPESERGAEVSEVPFRAVGVERATFRVELPAGLKDSSGRTLANAANFPLKVTTGESPPLAKFSAAPFGVVEWTGEAAVPVTLRHVQGDLRRETAAGKVRLRRLTREADVIAWHSRLLEHHETWRSAKDLGRPASEWFELRAETDARGRTVQRRVERMVNTREVSLLSSDREAKRLVLPGLDGANGRPLEVVGIPIAEPGYHVLEIESARLGKSLLGRPAPMFVRTGVLVTNLGVHFKHGRENSAVWVTSLDRGRPVADAEVAVHDCAGRRLWSGRTDAQGLAQIATPLSSAPAADRGCKPQMEGLFVTARKRDAKGQEDLAFVMSTWQRGIEPWRFAVPVSQEPQPDSAAHTVFDRTLLRAGETVSMKHFLRLKTGAGLGLPDAGRVPIQARIVHVGSGDEYTVPLEWQATRSATSAWGIPSQARLGAYEVTLERPATGAGASAIPARQWTAGDFRVEAFRVPLVEARVSGPKGALVAPREVALDVLLGHLNGGPVASAPLKTSALLRDRVPAFPSFEGFSFAPAEERSPETEGEDEAEATRDAGRLVADKVAATTSKDGAARVALKDLPAVRRPSEIVAEVSFTDPNGEIQTVGTTLPVWPAAVVPGLKASWWIGPDGRTRLTAAALDTAGKPLAGQALEVRGRLQQSVSTRKRLVGGFYAWDQRTVTQDLGVLCSGRSDERGLMPCEAVLKAAGQVELIVTAKDAQGRSAEAATSVWVSGQGDAWFTQGDDDRIEILPEKRRYEPGETARLQVRMPFRQATALVAVEREGVVQTRVVALRGQDPTVEVKIEKGWTPNVYVSVLALRGRVRETPWYSLFTWGWREPVEWARSFWYDGRDWRPPTAMVDLAKPAFRLGVAALEVGTAAHELQVTVTPDKPQYGVRETARVKLRVAQGGQPVPGAEVAFAAVDEGLLELQPNASWDLLGPMMAPRPWGVSTSTVQGEIVGRRHYGRKAVAAGGGGGRGGTRELFDTLLLWKARVTVDARGEAVVDVPINDSLTAFRFVAVADSGGANGEAQRFGTGSASVRVTQDLQIVAGLPTQVREGDRHEAVFTLRNTTTRAMTVKVTARGKAGGVAGQAAGAAARPLPDLPPQQLSLPAGGAGQVSWPLEVPAGATSITWEVSADETGGSGKSAKDSVKVVQAVTPLVPVRVVQATLQAWEGRGTLPVAPPADALPEAPGAGLAVTLQPRLGGALPGVRHFFETYRYTCLEQQVSRAVALRDREAWATLVNRLPTYLDNDGLATYFPRAEGDSDRGSDRLTAYLLATAHEAGLEWPAPLRQRMLDGLTAYVEGRIQRRTWSPRPDADVRRLAALEALSRHGRAQPRMTGPVAMAPAQWPTSAVIDWLSTLRRMENFPDRERRMEEARQVLRSRLTWSGTTLRFANEAEDAWWWLMEGPDGNAARLILAVMDEPSWRADVPRLVVGSLARQQRGAWSTTTANAWGVLALDRFAKRFESATVGGRTTVALASADGGVAAGSTATASPPSSTTAPSSRILEWARNGEGGRLELPWPAGPGTLQWQHEGPGAPWATVQALAAIPLKAPVRAGYAVTRTVSAAQRADPSRWRKGDIARVRLEIEASADMTWVVVTDPVPGGATVLGGGLARDSVLATRDERREGAVPAYEERGAEGMRVTWEFLPRGRHVVEYTVRLNHAGRFGLPPTRVEAMYAPERHGESPNTPWEVAP